MFFCVCYTLFIQIKTICLSAQELHKNNIFLCKKFFILKNPQAIQCRFSSQNGCPIFYFVGCCNNRLTTVKSFKLVRDNFRGLLKLNKFVGTFFHVLYFTVQRKYHFVTLIYYFMEGSGLAGERFPQIHKN